MAFAKKLKEKEKMRIGYRTFVMRICITSLACIAGFSSCKNESGNSSGQNAAFLAGLIPGVSQQTQNAVSVNGITASSFSASDTASQINTAFAQQNDGSFTFDDSIKVTAQDGIILTANIFKPVNPPAGVKYPAVVFVNSWALNKYEYLVPAAILAKKGYVVLSYNTRGFGTSGGLINTAGPLDRQDLSSILDWLLANAPVDAANIGIGGISYGAGISLIGVSEEPRIKTAVAMSGWGDLKRSLYGNSTPRIVWGLLLIGSGYFLGHMDPVIAQYFQNLLAQTNIAAVTTWAQDRSPDNFVAQLNAAGKPVYMSNNFEDDLFNPNEILDYYSQLTVPKKLDLNEGIHASAELPGILGLSNYVWSNAYDWFDYWLKGVNNGIMSKPQVSFQKKFNGDRVTLPSWPSPTVSQRTYYLKPRGFFTDGQISTTQNTSNANTGILSGADTLATSGVPIISDILAAHLDVPVTVPIGLISRINGIVYQSDTLTSAIKIRGKIFWNGIVSSSLGKANINVYFYDLDTSGIGTLITHGTATIFDAAPGETRNLSIDLNAVAYDLPAGHKIAIAMDTYDPLYSVPTLLIYALNVKHSASQQSTLVIQSE
ncbi:X-Pro dipeptidyl-peptidase C-terminal non-catalytic domain protein [Leptospira broomii serovar Hurstbridge str. 5399]|uniref:X-Pro dipeptidyl-peptidase C-terminal non-catalytic domain protein n=2 Tax=Leptospira broomii TaxID=301541 RepID=T0GIQ8_9LEPT|nr:X-Pro dipeptidyl-peptidase C-terminal non-catalytic domain protein [Leptospira broomii serovar Hurstbridge str. 5399]